jgi:hypothetical protein
MAHDTLSLLMEQIDEARLRIVEDLGDGKAKDYAAYQYSAGVIRGLLTAQRMVIDLSKNMEEQDE